MFFSDLSLFQSFAMEKLTSDTAESDSSQPIQPGQDKHRCMNCSRSMTKSEIDPHLICSYCRNQECNFDVRCDECVNWSPSFMASYVKYFKSLARKRESKRKLRAQKKESVPDFVVACTGGDSGSQDHGVEHGDSGALLDQVSELLDDRVRVIDQGITDRFQSLTKELAGGLRDQFISLAGEMKEFVKSSIPAPKEVAVDCSRICFIQISIHQFLL